MNTITVDVRDLPGKLADLLSQVAAGAEVLLRDGESTALLAAKPARREWKLGLHPGAMVMRDDFCDPIDEEDFLKGNI